MSRREWAWVGVAVLCALGWLARPLSSEAVIGALFGAAVGAVISWHFSERASNELRIEAKELRKTTEHAIRMLQTISGGGKARAITDEQGKTRGVAHYTTVTDQLDTTDSVQVSKTSDEDPKPSG